MAFRLIMIIDVDGCSDRGEGVGDGPEPGLGGGQGRAGLEVTARFPVC